MKTLTIVSLAALFFLSCEDFLKKEITIDAADSSPKVCVTSALEDSLFYIFLSLSSPINNPAGSPERVKEAEVRLYEDDKLILEITKRDTIDSRYPEYTWYNDMLPFATRTDVRVTPGKTYTLKVQVEGYPPVSSAVTAPDAVEVTGCSVDSRDPIFYEDDKTAYLNSDYYPHCNSYFPFTVSIKDNPGEKDYYMIQACEVAGEGRSIYDLYLRSERLLVATPERSLVQDNPDVVADQTLNDPEISLFSFGQMILSDLTFQGQEKTLQLLLASCQLNINDNNCDWIGQRPHYETHYGLYIIIRRLSEESYHYYRTFALQKIGLDFFSEPVSLASNIEGGYGCFAICTTTRVLLKEYKVCYLQR